MTKEGYTRAQRYIKRNFDGIERTPQVQYIIAPDGKVIDAKILVSSGNAKYDRLIRKDALSQKFSPLPSDRPQTRTRRINIVEKGSKKHRETQQRARRRRKPEKRNQQDEAQNQKKITPNPKPTPT